MAKVQSLSKCPFEVQHFKSSVDFKFSSDLRFLGLSNCEGKLTISRLGNKQPHDSIEVPSNRVQRFEFSQCDPYDVGFKLVVVDCQGVAFYSLESLNHVPASENEELGAIPNLSLKCIQRLTREDLHSLLTDKDFDSLVRDDFESFPKIKIVKYDNGYVILAVQSSVLVFRDSGTEAGFTLISKFKTDVGDLFESDLHATTGWHLFCFNLQQSTIYIYNMGNGSLITVIRVHEILKEYFQDSAPLKEVKQISVSRNGEQLAFMDSRSNLFYINLGTVILPLTPPSASSHAVNAVDGECKSATTECTELSERDHSNWSDCQSIVETVSQHSDVSGVDLFRSTSLIAVESITLPFWVKSYRQKDIVLTGFSTRASHKCISINYEPVSFVKTFVIQDGTITLWHGVSSETLGGLTLIDLETLSVKTEIRFDEPTMVSFEKNVNIPHLLITDEALSAFICNESQQETVNKFLLVESASESLSMSLSVLEQSLKNRELDAVVFFLRSRECDPDAVDSVGNDIQQLSDIVKLLTTTIEECLLESTSRSFGEQLFLVTQNYLRRLHKNLSAHSKKRAVSHEMKDKAAQLSMESVIQLQSLLRNYPDLGSLEQPSDLPHVSMEQQLKTFPDLLNLWRRWSSLSRKEIICDAIMMRCLPLAQAYFLTQAPVNCPDNILDDVQKVALDWVITLLEENNLRQSKVVLNNVGFNPHEKLHELCFRTANSKLRLLLEDELRKYNMLTADEEITIKWLHQLESIYSCKSSITAESQQQDLCRGREFRRALTPAFDISAKEIKLMPDMESSGSEKWTNVDQPCLVLEWMKSWSSQTFSRILKDACETEIDLNAINTTHADIETELEFYLKQEDASRLIDWIQDIFSSDHDSTVDSKLSSVDFCEYLLNIIESSATPLAKDLLLDELARFGIFLENELSSFNLLIKRIRSIYIQNKSLTMLESAHAKLTLDEFHNKIFQFCIKNSLIHILYDHTEELCDHALSTTRTLSEWCSMMVAFRQWAKNPIDSKAILQASLCNACLSIGQDISNVGGLFRLGKFIAGLATLMCAVVPLTKALELDCQNDDDQRKVSQEELIVSLKQHSVLKATLLPFIENEIAKPRLQDITVYQILNDRTVLDVPSLFSWQSTNSLRATDAFPDLPNFSHPDLVKTYGQVQNLDFSFHLLQGRPSFAYAAFVVQCISGAGVLLRKQIRDACNLSHSIAVQHFSSHVVTAACIAFMEMLNWNTFGLRIDLEVANFILTYWNRSLPDSITGMKREEAQKNQRDEIRLLFCSAFKGMQQSYLKLLDHVEKAVVDNLTVQEANKICIDAFNQWSLVTQFCQRHDLPYSTTYLKRCAAEDDWITFALFAEIHSYPRQLMLQIVDHFKSKQLVHYLQNAFSHLSYHSSASQNARSSKLDFKNLSRDLRANLYARIGVRASKQEKEGDKTAEKGSTSDEDAKPESSSDELTDLSTSSLASCESSLEASLKNVPADLLGVVMHCHLHPCPWQSLLTCSMHFNNPVLAILAACYEDAAILDCLCVWLVTTASLDLRIKLVKEPLYLSIHHTWQLSDFYHILVELVSSVELSLLSEGLFYFLPDSSLFDLSKFLQTILQEKSYSLSGSYLKNFVHKFENMQSDAELNVGSKEWLTKACVGILNEALVNIRSPHERTQFLKLLHEVSVENLFYATTNYTVLLRILELLLDTEIAFDSRNLVAPLGSATFESECGRILEALLREKMFSRAFEFVTITGFSKTTVVLAEMRDELSVQRSQNLITDLGAELATLKWCLAKFKENDVSYGAASSFLKEHGLQLEQPCSRYCFLSFSWEMRNLELCSLTEDGFSVNPCDRDLEREMWMARIDVELLSEENDAEIGQMINELDILKRELSSVSKNKTSQDVITHPDITSVQDYWTLNNEEQKGALEKIIGQELDQGNVDVAYRLSVLFQQKIVSLDIILTCMKLAEGAMEVHHIDINMRLLLERNSTLKPKKLSSRSLNHSFTRSPNSATSLESADKLSVHMPAAEIIPDSRNDILDIMLRLLNHCHLGAICCSRVITIYEIAQVLNIPYIEIIQNWDDATLLKALLQSGSADRFNLAKDFILANNLDDEFIAVFLCEHILCALRMFTGNANAKDQCLRSSDELVLKPTDTSSTFEQLAKLFKDPSVLGDRLLGLTELPSMELPMEVELCIRAHSCFTVACRVEGITKSLQKAKRFTKKLTEAGEFSLMVRLLTGIGRFSEMAYIFDILRENHQFELLFRKGMEKVPNLKMALLDYTRRLQPFDTETFTMIALHFSMYREIAEMLEMEAKTLIEQTGSVDSRDNKKDWVQKTLDDVIQYLSDAAESYSKAECIQHALSCAKRAELVALQIYLLPTGINILNLTQSQVTEFVSNHSNIHEALIVIEAYNQHPDWSLALYNNFIVKGNKDYMADFQQIMSLSSSIIEEVIRRYQRDGNKTGRMASNMKWLLTKMDDVHLTYKLAEELGFNDFSMDMLRKENANFLLDTVQNRRQW